jgi:hypothetical protein
MTAGDLASHTVATGCCLSVVPCSQAEALRIAHVLPLNHNNPFSGMR